MSEHHTIRVPVPVIVLLSAMILACGSTEDYGDDNYTYTDNSGSSGWSASAPTTNELPPPSAPTIPSYLPEHDMSKPPDVPKTTDVTIQYGRPPQPSDNFWETLKTRYSPENHRGYAGDALLFDDSWSFADSGALLVAETVTNGGTKYAHGLVFATFDRSQRRYMANEQISTDDPHLYVFGYMRDGYLHGPVWVNDIERAKQGLENRCDYIIAYEHGIPTGEVRWYDDTNHLQATGWYSNNQRNGTYTQWDSGKTWQCEYVNGMQHGAYREWNSWGQLVRRGTVHDGKYYGRQEVWIPGDRLPYGVSYFNGGAAYGWYSMYNEEGHLTEQVWRSGGSWNGQWVHYNGSGQKDWSGTYSNGLRHGVYSRFTAEGHCDYDTEYKNDAQTGQFHYYDENGVVTEEGEFIDGMREGTVKFYNPSGWTGLLERNYVAGVAQGITRLYDAEGKLRAEGNMKDGKLNGKATEYDNEGAVSRELEYKDGEVVNDTAEGEEPVIPETPEDDEWSPFG